MNQEYKIIIPMDSEDEKEPKNIEINIGAKEEVIQNNNLFTINKRLLISILGLTIITLMPIFSYSQNTVSKQLVTYSVKNLDVDKFKDGTPITEAVNAEEWIRLNNEKKPAFCYFRYNKEYGKSYGKLYNYWAIKSPLGIAPEGWHIPNIYEMAMAINKSNIIDAEIKNTQLSKYDGIYLPNPIRMFIKDSILSNASGFCEKSGNFFGMPYNKSPNYNWWAGAWWINTELNEKGLVALKVKSMTETDAVDAEFEAQNQGFGYSAICFKDYFLPIKEDYKIEEISKMTVTYQSKNLDVDKFKDGTKINEAKTSEEWINFNKEMKPAYCYYKYNRYYGVNYGKIYNYWATISPLGIAPEGWHIPNILELMSAMGKTDIPKSSIETTDKIAYGGNICNPISKERLNFSEIQKFEELAGSKCESNGGFYLTSLNNKQNDKPWGGSWWSSNSIHGNNSLSPISLKISANPDNPYTKNIIFETSNFNEGCSILCFKDYKIDSAEIEKNVYIVASKKSNSLSIIDTITVNSISKKKINVYTTKDGTLLTEFLLLGNTYIQSYLKWGKTSDYFSNPDFKNLIIASLNTGLFLTNFKNIDWLNKKIVNNDQWIDSKFRSFELLFDLNTLPQNEKYFINIPELKIQQDLIIDTDGFASFKIDTAVLNYIDQLPYKNLNENNANKELSFQILNKYNKPFAGVKRYFYTNESVEKNSFNYNSSCNYVEVKNETVQLKANYYIDYGSTNYLVHSLYFPLMDSLIRHGRIIEASSAFDKSIRKLLPNYFSANENEWPNKQLRHKVNFDNLLAEIIFNFSGDPTSFLDAYKQADIKSKYIFKKAYYYFGQKSNELTKSLISLGTQTYNDYLLSSLLEYILELKDPIRIGAAKNVFDFKSPILFKLDQISLPEASYDGESDWVEPLKWVNKAIVLEPNNPLGYLYRANFKGCKKIQVYHDACTVSDWCINCKDLQKAYQLDQNRTKLSETDLVGFTFVDNLNTDNYYESFYKLECVNCQLCFYNICGGESKSKSIQTGKRGGKYYINKNGNKNYIKQKK